MQSDRRGMLRRAWSAVRRAHVLNGPPGPIAWGKGGRLSWSWLSCSSQARCNQVGAGGEGLAQA